MSFPAQKLVETYELRPGERFLYTLILYQKRPDMTALLRHLRPTYGSYEFFFFAHRV